jgi:hypothetical protein
LTPLPARNPVLPMNDATIACMLSARDLHMAAIGLFLLGCSKNLDEVEEEERSIIGSITVPHLHFVEGITPLDG